MKTLSRSFKIGRDWVGVLFVNWNTFEYFNTSIEVLGVAS